MLTPKKHLNLNVSVLRVAALMLRESQKRGVVELESLRRTIIRRAGLDAEVAFLPALGFLYLLGKIEYHLQNDTIEYKAG